MANSATAPEHFGRTPGTWLRSSAAPSTTTTHGLGSGFTELDLLLPEGGWPVGALTEIYAERPGIGELQLLMPAAAALTQDGQRLAIVGPPCMPYAPALAARGVQLQHVLMLRPQAMVQQAKTCEQLLLSGNCGMLLVWQDQWQEPALQRLQRSAEHSGAIVVVFRTRRANPSANATLRLHVSRYDGRTVVHVLKRGDDRMSLPVKLDLHGSLTRRPPAIIYHLQNPQSPRLQSAH